MLKYFIYFAVLIPVAISQTPTPSPFICDPILDCKDATKGDKVPDPEDCTKFYVCIAGTGTDLVPTDSSLSCPSDQYFDQFTAACADETTGTCENLCKNKPPSVCDTTCTDFKFESVAYAGDCSKYYVCTPSGPIEQTCNSPNLYYNGTLCVADKSECCDFCTPYCTEQYTQIPDPYDCTSYYVCMAVGPPDDNYHPKCSSGKYFNPDTASCIPGTDCVSTCSNSTDSDNTTPSTVTSITSTAPTTASITSTAPTAASITSAAPTTASITSAAPTTASITSTAPTTSSITSTTPASTLTTASKSTGNPITTSSSAGNTNATTKTTDSITTTTATSTTTTTISTTLDGCKNTYVCMVNGNFPRCPYCDPTYFSCQSGSAVIKTCDTGKVFNTNPAYPYCIIPSDCPYPN